jgi:hypothetical protein
LDKIPRSKKGGYPGVVILDRVSWDNKVEQENFIKEVIERKIDRFGRRLEVRCGDV